MSYLVLARKYRPQTFADVVGQEHVTRTVANAIAAGRVHHAFLLCGARGVGKTTTARILAKAICCEQGPTATPCDVCDACLEIKSGQSVDVIELDAASNNSVEDVRVLREGVRYLPARLRRKVIILDEAHMLSNAAFNALLKTLEEPPAHVLFIFATTDPQKLPITILSRCQRYDFKLVPTPRIAQHLEEIAGKESIEADRVALQLVAREAQGSVRDGLSLLDQVIAFVGTTRITREAVVESLGIADRAALFRLTGALFARDAQSALEVVDAQVVRGVDLGMFARALAGHLRDLTVVASCREPAALIDATDEELAELVTQTAGLEAGLVRQCFEIATRAVDEIGRSQTPRFQLELVVLDLCHAEPLLPLGDLLERLEQIEARVDRGGPPSPARPREPAARAAPPAPPKPTTIAAPAAVAAPAPIAVVPAPVAAPAPAAPPVEQPRRWPEFVQSLCDERPDLFAFLADSRLAGIDGGAVAITVKGGFEKEQLEMQSGDIEKLLARWLGREAKFKVSIDGTATSPSGPSLAEQEAAAQKATQQRILDEERQHPNINYAERAFGAVKRDVKVLE